MSRQLVRAKLREVSLSSSRPSMPETVNSLAESMRASGLINPIIVKRAPVFDGTLMVEGYKVIAGNHRVSAARALGWDEIEAFVVDGDATLEAELIEIDENLVRAELTPAQRAAAIKRRKEVWEAMHPQGGKSVSTLGGEQRVGFASDTSAVAGITKQAINQHVSRAEALGDDLEEVVGTSLDKGVELDALAKLPEDERRDLIQKAKAGEPVSARMLADDPDRLRRLVMQTIAEITRLERHGSPEDVAEIMATVAINPSLTPYVEAIFNAYRAKRRAA